MKRIHAALACLLVLVALPVLGFAGEQTVVDRVIAVVNSDIITLSDLEEASAPFVARATARVTNAAARAKAAAQVRAQVLDTMISDKLVDQQAKELGIVVTDREVDSQLEQIKKANGLTDAQLLEQLQRQGMTLERLRKDITTNRKRLKLIDFKVKPRVTIGEDQIRAFYDKNYETDDEVRVSLITWRLPPAASDAERKEIRGKAEAARKRILGGEAFADVAKAETEGPNRDKGGDMGWFRRGDLNETLEQAAFDLEKGEISEPVEAGGSIHIIQATDRRSQPAQSFADVHEKIYQILYAREAEKEYGRWVEELRDKGFVDVRLDKPLKG